MKKLGIMILIMGIVASCNTMFKPTNSTQTSATGQVIEERGFRLPERFDNFRLDIIRRKANQGRDFIYLRAEHVGPERLMVTKLWVNIDGDTTRVYEVPPSQTLRADQQTPDGRDRNRYYLRQVEHFIFTENLLNLMLEAKTSVTFTIIGENQHYGANLYTGQDLESFQTSLRDLAKKE